MNGWRPICSNLSGSMFLNFELLFSTCFRFGANTKGTIGRQVTIRQYLVLQYLGYSTNTNYSEQIYCTLSYNWQLLASRYLALQPLQWMQLCCILVMRVPVNSQLACGAILLRLSLVMISFPTFVRSTCHCWCGAFRQLAHTYSLADMPHLDKSQSPTIELVLPIHGCPACQTG